VRFCPLGIAAGSVLRSTTTQTDSRLAERRGQAEADRAAAYDND